MPNVLTSLKECSVVVADSGDIDAIAKWKPQDTTTNPSLLLTSAQDPRYQGLVESAYGKDVESTLDNLFVAFGAEILKHIPGRVSTEVDARLSFDETLSVQKAKRIISLYEARNISRERVRSEERRVGKEWRSRWSR